LGVFKPGALHKTARIHGSTVLLAPIKALLCPCFLPSTTGKNKPLALRVVGGSGMFCINHILNKVNKGLLWNRFFLKNA
jgi:hypothetical protein